MPFLPHYEYHCWHYAFITPFHAAIWLPPLLLRLRLILIDIITITSFHFLFAITASLLAISHYAFSLASLRWPLLSDIDYSLLTLLITTIFAALFLTPLMRVTMFARCRRYAMTRCHYAILLIIINIYFDADRLFFMLSAYVIFIRYYDAFIFRRFTLYWCRYAAMLNTLYAMLSMPYFDDAATLRWLFTPHAARMLRWCRLCHCLLPLLYAAADARAPLRHADDTRHAITFAIDISSITDAAMPLLSLISMPFFMPLFLFASLLFSITFSPRHFSLSMPLPLRRLYHWLCAISSSFSIFHYYAFVFIFIFLRCHYADYFSFIISPSYFIFFADAFAAIIFRCCLRWCHMLLTLLLFFFFSFIDITPLMPPCRRLFSPPSSLFLLRWCFRCRLWWAFLDTLLRRLIIYWCWCFHWIFLIAAIILLLPY